MSDIEVKPGMVMAIRADKLNKKPTNKTTKNPQVRRVDLTPTDKFIVVQPVTDSRREDRDDQIEATNIFIPKITAALIIGTMNRDLYVWPYQWTKNNCLFLHITDIKHIGMRETKKVADGYNYIMRSKIIPTPAMTIQVHDYKIIKGVGLLIKWPRVLRTDGVRAAFTESATLQISTERDMKIVEKTTQRVGPFKGDNMFTVYTRGNYKC